MGGTLVKDNITEDDLLREMLEISLPPMYSDMIRADTVVHTENERRLGMRAANPHPPAHHWLL